MAKYHLTESDRAAVASALLHSAADFRGFCERQEPEFTPRLKEQFARQAEDNERLADIIEQAERVAVES